jgi:hypothetical protein
MVVFIIIIYELNILNFSVLKYKLLVFKGTKFLFIMTITDSKTKNNNNITTNKKKKYSLNKN